MNNNFGPLNVLFPRRRRLSRATFPLAPGVSLSLSVCLSVSLFSFSFSFRRLSNDEKMKEERVL